MVENKAGGFADRVSSLLDKYGAEQAAQKEQAKGDLAGQERSKLEDARRISEFSRTARLVIRPTFEKCQAVFAARGYHTNIVFAPLEAGDSADPGEIGLVFEPLHGSATGAGKSYPVEPPMLSYKYLPALGKVERRKSLPSNACLGSTHSAVALAGDQIMTETVERDVLDWIQEVVAGLTRRP